MAKFQIPRSLFERILAAGREQVYIAGFSLEALLFEVHEIQEVVEPVDAEELGIELIDD